MSTRKYTYPALLYSKSPLCSAFEEDARISCEKLHGSTIDGRRIQVEVASAGKHVPSAREMSRGSRAPTFGAHELAPPLESDDAPPSKLATLPEPNNAVTEGRKRRRRETKGEAAADSTEPGDVAPEGAASTSQSDGPLGVDSVAAVGDAVVPAVTKVAKRGRKAAGVSSVAAPAGSAEPAVATSEPASTTVSKASGKQLRLDEMEDVAGVSTPSAEVATLPQPTLAAPVEAVPFARKSAYAALTRERTLHLFGLPASFDKKRLWKRLRKHRGAADLQFPVVLPGNAQCCVATLTFPSRFLRDKACARLEGHVVLGHTLSARGGEALLTRRDAVTQGRLIVRNLRFDATPQHILNAALRNAGRGVAAMAVHIHVPVKPGSPLPPAPSLSVALACGPAAAQKRARKAGKTEAASDSGGADADVSAGGMGASDDDEEPGDDAVGDDTGAGDGGALDSTDESDASDDAAEGGGADSAAAGTVAVRAGPTFRNRGFAFIEFATRAAAESAVTGMNGCRVHRRQVVVDWVLSKEDFAAAGAAAAVATGEAADADLSESETKEPKEGADDAAVDEDEDAAAEGVEPGEEHESDASSQLDEDAEEDEDGDSADGDASKAQTVEAGMTLFIQNLPFDATSAQLRDALSVFGGVRYAQVVMDRELSRSKGTSDTLPLHSKYHPLATLPLSFCRKRLCSVLPG